MASSTKKSASKNGASKNGKKTPAKSAPAVQTRPSRLLPAVTSGDVGLSAGDLPSPSSAILASVNGVRRVPAAYNEPIRSYAPGSPERAELKARIDRMATE